MTGLVRPIRTTRLTACELVDGVPPTVDEDHRLASVRVRPSLATRVEASSTPAIGMGLEPRHRTSSLIERLLTGQHGGDVAVVSDQPPLQVPKRVEHAFVEESRLVRGWAQLGCRLPDLCTALSSWRSRYR